MPLMLPMPLLLKRLENEERELEENGYSFEVEDLHDGKNGTKVRIVSTFGEEEVEAIKRYRVKINANGYEKRDGKIVERNTHEVYIYILRHYPLPSARKLGAPIRFQWITPIFHPNIAQGIAVGGSGVVCWNIVKEWIPSFTLLRIVEGLEKLVETPNPDDALIYPECREAANWFRRVHIHV